VIAKHVEHILTTIHKKLLWARRFQKREAAMSLHISQSEPADSSLTMQLAPDGFVVLQVEPTTGNFTMQQPSKFTLQGENRLNYTNKDPSEVGAAYLENTRWQYLADEVIRKGKSAGWMHTRSPLSLEDLRAVLRLRESFHPVSFRRSDIDPSWVVMLVMSLQGDEWWIFQM
jgi:mediator of RNA polymerase II transcription subunit 14